MVCDGGSRARAMAIWQASCEVEIVPSLHSNLAGAVSATGAGRSGAAGGCGADACATGFWKPVQPAQQRQISMTRPNRIRAASGDACGGRSGLAPSLANQAAVSSI
jgi:hypothetical protein